MKKPYSGLFSTVMFFISTVAFVCLLGADFTDLFGRLSHIIKFITAFAVFVFGYFGALVYGISHSDRKRRRRVMKNTLTLLFFAYIIIVVDFTLIDDSFGRELSYIFSKDSAAIGSYIEANTNIVPFKTIRLFIRGYSDNNVTFQAFAENLLGNFCVFMPCAFFMPILIRRQKKFICFALTVAFLVIAIELLQLVLLTGSSDIDDFILNVSGALFAFGFLRLKAMQKMLQGLTFGL